MRTTKFFANGKEVSTEWIINNLENVKMKDSYVSAGFLVEAESLLASRDWSEVLPLAGKSNMKKGRAYVDKDGLPIFYVKTSKSKRRGSEVWAVGALRGKFTEVGRYLPNHFEGWAEVSENLKKETYLITYSI